MPHPLGLSQPEVVSHGDPGLQTGGQQSGSMPERTARMWAMETAEEIGWAMSQLRRPCGLDGVLL